MDIEADYYFAAGDMVTWARGFEKVGPVLTRRAGKLFLLPGNHESVNDIDRCCREYGITNFHGQTLQLQDYWIVGLGYSSPTPFHTPGEYSEREIAERLSAFAGLQPLILICHCPPRDTPLDQIRPGLHAGSSAVAQFIQQQQPRYFFCGHIHEAEGACIRLGATAAMNVGKKGYLLEL